MQAASLRVGQQSLLGYLPAIVIQKILEGEIDSTKNLPAYHKIFTVSLFADISGFTKLSEAFSKKGRIGPEFLAFSLNRYMEQLINIIGKNGGDIFKFAGDAILVVWPPTSRIEESCQRAIQCALDIQGKLNNQEISPNKRLSVKIGIGVGECTILVVGGQFGRCEYLSVGDALAQACESETKAEKGGETICSEDVYRYVRDKFEFQEAVGGDDHGHGPSDHDMKFYKIIKITGERVQIKADAFLMRTKFSLDKLREKLSVLKAFVPAAIVKYLDIEKEVWSKEIRMISSMFLNLKVDLKQTKSDEGIQRIQKIVKTVQRCVYRTKGSLNKFLMDDKGSVMVICWGLPPLSSPDDHIRSVLCGQTLISELKNLKCGAYMGIATGTCFTGVCGTIGGRREYSLLGEIVNLSARHMQKAIYYAKDLSVERNVKVDYLCLVDERTKDLMQNKIFSQYLCKDFLKGFQNEFNFYEPLHDSRSTYDCNLVITVVNINLFPEIKTHNHNIPMYQLPPNNKKEIKHFLNKSLFMLGKKRDLEMCKATLNKVYKNEESVRILVRGVFGSGKSLFCRKLLYEFFDQNKELKLKLMQNSHTLPFVLVSYQMPTTSYNPFNGWQNIFREIYNVLAQEIEKKGEEKEPNLVNFGSEVININCDFFGKLLFKSDNYSNIKYIEEILGIDFSKHIDLEKDNENFNKFFQIKQLADRDPFFMPRKFDKNEAAISKFFSKMLKRYRQLLDSYSSEEQYKYPLVFVIEDCHLIDEVSIDFINLIECKLNNIAIICTYQDPLTSLVQNPLDKFVKYLDTFGDKVVNMENITDLYDCQELIRQNLEGRLNIEKIDPELINIILPKSFKGNPLFLLDIVESLIKESNKYVQHPGQELLTTSELIDMDNDNDWINFNVPMRIEKLVGHIIDSLDCREIVLLKYASTIGNIFDIDKLSKLSPFNTLTFDDLYTILQRLEVQGFIEILYDLEPKKMVCQFCIPFCRELLYQRMLIEQRNDIHMNIARLMQYNKFSYMTSKREISVLKSHLKKTEKSIINYMEEEDNEPGNREESKFSTTTNQKIVLVKEICQKLKVIDMKIEEDEQVNKGIPLIIEGMLSKKSDANITWENRYIVITNKRFYYYYTDKDYKENKEPLGYFEMKNLYNLQILPDFTYGSRKNIFTITVSQWMKKDQTKPGRGYILSADTKEKLNDWVTTINFLRVKATYDEFACQFGMIHLPLAHEILKNSKRKIKKKFTPTNTLIQKKFMKSNNYYNSIARKSIIPSKTSDSADKLKHISRRQKEQDNQKKIVKTKENITQAFSLVFVCLLGFVQDIIFNPENIENYDEKILTIPKFLKEFREMKPENPEYAKRETKHDIFSAKKIKEEVIKEEKEEDSDNTETEDVPKNKGNRKGEKSVVIQEKVNSELKKSITKEPEVSVRSPESKKKERIEEKSNNDMESTGKKGSVLEKLNPNIKLPLTNILNSNPVVKKILTRSEGNTIANKLKNFEISNDEDDIYFANNNNHYSNLVDDEKEGADDPKREDHKKDKKSYLDQGKYKDVKVPQKYNNYSSNLFKSNIKK